MLSTLFQWLDWVGVVVFALSGALVAARKEVDIVGFILLALVTGIGGGTARDVILDRTPVFWVQDPIYVWLCVVPAIFVFVWAQGHVLNRQWLLWADALGLGVFSVIGCNLALETGASPIVAIFMGIMTATFGGIIRDVLAGEATLVFRREIYVTAAALGAASFWLLNLYEPTRALAPVIGVLTGFGLRGLAIAWRLTLPGYKSMPIHSPERRGKKY